MPSSLYGKAEKFLVQRPPGSVADDEAGGQCRNGLGGRKAALRGHGWRLPVRAAAILVLIGAPAEMIQNVATYACSTPFLLLVCEDLLPLVNSAAAVVVIHRFLRRSHFDVINRNLIKRKNMVEQRARSSSTSSS